MSMIICFQLAGGPCVIHWINDNTSAISWVTKNMAKSKAAQFAFLVYTWLGLVSGVRVVSSEHIPGLSMGCVDKLSRFEPTPELSPAEDWSNCIPLDLLNDLFVNCDPVSAGQSNLANWEEVMLDVIPKVVACLSRWPVSTTKY
jgi:hypothetical protein